MKNLRKLFGLLVVVLVIFSASSCSNDDDSPSIVGKWNFTKEGTIVNGQEVLVDYEHTAGCNKDNIQFSAAGTFVGKFYAEECLENTINGTWTKSGKTLTIDTGDIEPVVLQIMTLSGSTLKLKETTVENGVE
jgi:hypothetical protein